MNPIRDVDDLRAAIASCSTADERRTTIREARRLGRTDILPRAWNLLPRPVLSGCSNPEGTLALKADASGIDVAKLRCVYMRGVSEFDALTSCGVSRDEWAHARVNSFIRLTAGSTLARKDDNDLIARP